MPPFSRCPDTLPFVPLFCEISRPRDARQPTVWNYSVRDLELFSAFIWEVTRLLKERFLYEPGLSGKEFLCLEGDRFSVLGNCESVASEMQRFIIIIISD